MNKKFFTLAAVMLVALFGLIEPAMAQNNSVMGIAASKALNAFSAVRTIIFIVGGFGLVGIAFAAIFGKMQWKWFAALAVGLAILAAAGSIVNYATTNEVQTTNSFTSGFSQTIGGNTTGDTLGQYNQQ